MGLRTTITRVVSMRIVVVRIFFIGVDVRWSDPAEESSTGDQLVLNQLSNGAEKRVYELGPFRLDATSRLLMRDGAVVALKQKAVDLLVVLVESRGEVLEKDILMQRLWPDIFVEEANLTQTVYILRKALGDDVIETIPRRGYRFVGEVREAMDDATEMIVAESTKASIVIEERQQTMPRAALIAIAVVVVAVVLTLFVVRTRDARKHAPSVAAHQAYLKARFFWNKRTEEGLRKSIEYFQQAVDADPQYALAYSGLADAYVQLPGYGATSSMEIYPKAKAAADTALRLDPLLAEAHNSVATVRSFFEWDWAGAEREYRKAIALNPSYAAAHQRLGVQLAAQKRVVEARAELLRAQQLEPLSLIINALVGFTWFESGDYDRAIAQLRATIEMDRNFPPAHQFLAHVYQEKGMPAEAFAEYLEWRRSSGDGDAMLARYRNAFAQSGLNGFLRERLAVLLEQSATQSGIEPMEIAALYAQLGDKENAFVWIEKAIEQHEGETIWLKALPDYDNVRDDPRFGELLKRVNLAS